MLLYYFTDNFITLMLLAALVVVLILNRSEKISAARYFGIAVVLLLLTTAADTIARWSAGDTPIPFFTRDIDVIVHARTVCDTIAYAIRPSIVMLQVMITSPRMGKYKSLLALPAIANALIYATALFGSKAAFWVSLTNHWYRGPLGFAIYFTMLFYVFMLALFSVIYFKTENAKRSALVFLIVIQAVLGAVFEYTGILPGITETLIALAMLEYYFYLSVIYQSEMRETIAEKELHLTKQRMLLLRNQIQPHFIFNSLSVIRSLAKRDTPKAVSSIDSFSDYLKAHIYFIQDDELISFEKELGHVKAYLALVQADSMRNVEVSYDLPVTNFMIPPLTLEPIVENAFKHGTAVSGGEIRIATDENDAAYIITVSDSGRNNGTDTAAPGSGLTEKESRRLGVGIENTRTRLKMQCNGSLDMKIDKEAGSTVTIRIPKNTDSPA